jgi:hypothetical protein
MNTHNEGAEVVPSAHNDALCRHARHGAVAETRWRGIGASRALQQCVTTDTARIKGLRRPVSITPTAVLVGAWVQTHSVTKQ